MVDLDSIIEKILTAAELLSNELEHRIARQNFMKAMTELDEGLNELRSQYDGSGDVEYLNYAIDGGEKAVSALPPYCPDVVLLSDLSTDLATRFEHMKEAGDTDDLTRGINYLQAAINAITPNAPEQLIGCLYNLAKLYSTRYLRTNEEDDIKRAVHTAESAVRAMPTDWTRAPDHLLQLSICLARLSEHTHDIELLQRAIEFSKAAVIATPQKDDRRSLQTNSLARLLSMRFEAKGASADLNDAIDLLDSCVPQLRIGHPDRVIGINYMGILLGIRFEEDGAMEDLANAISWSELALAETIELGPDRAMKLSNLANRLFRRGERTGQASDISAAIDHALEGLGYPGISEPERAKLLINLSNCFKLRFQQHWPPPLDDLHQAIKVAERAIALCPDGGPNLAAAAQALANLLRMRHALSDNAVDLDDAISNLETAVRSLPAHHRDHIGLQHGLGKTCELKYRQTGTDQDLERSAAAYKAGWACENASPTIRIDCASKAAEKLATQAKWKEASTYLEYALGLLHAVSPRHLQNTDKERMLERFAGLSTYAAAISLNAGKEAAHALQLLEVGRSIISGLVLGLRTDLSSLRQEYPDLAEEFMRVRNRLDSGGELSFFDESRESISTFSSVSGTQTGRKAEEQLDTILNKIRAKPKFEDFLLPPTINHVMAAADPGPIVIINISTVRCDAFLVERQQIRVLHLPALALDDIQKRSKRLRTNPESLESTLAWLWDVLARPVLDVLGFGHPPSSDSEWPHIWWVLTGPLSYLPIHAAGYHRRGLGETTLDRVMSSYSSSIKTLIAGRQRTLQPIPRDSTGNALLVSMPKTPGQSSLPFAESEIAMLSDLCPSMNLTPIRPPEHRRAILDLLPSCRIFHFAGHGLSHPSEPARSCLVLGDGNHLTVNDLRTQRLQDHAPFLAYLSACSTSANDNPRLVEEAVHLANACQLAGFRHVISTMWVVSDMFCVEVARRLYGTIRDEDATDAAVCRGLHDAVRALRDVEFRDGAKVTGRGGEDGYSQVGDSLVAADTGESVGQGPDNHGESVNGELRKAVVAGSGSQKWLWVPYIHFGV